MRNLLLASLLAAGCGASGGLPSPPCHDVAPGGALPGVDAPNVSCLAACTNVAGAWTCIKAGGVTAYCDNCQ